MNEKMVVAYVCDERYKKYLQISMNSFRRYNKNIEFAILSAVPFEVEGAKVYTFTPHNELFKFKEMDRMGDGVYYKLYLPLLPYKKILYVDCDVLCQRPLNELWNTECEFICGTESHMYGKLQAKELGLDRYMITGMMLMNLEALRACNFTDTCLQYLRTHHTVKWHDETIINSVYHDKLKFVDKKFNYCRNRVYEDPIPESDAYILHFVSLRNKRRMLQMTDFKALDAIKDEFKGKKVAIVGNCSRVLKSNQGQEIDAHDIVIRFNRGYPSDAVGHKTNYLWLACTLSDEERLIYGRRTCTIARSNLCRNICHFRISVTDRTRFAQYPNAEVRQTRPGKLSQASTGFIAIQHALSTDCKSIDLYGFDFFKTQTYYNPADYVTLHNGDKEAEKVLEYEKYGLLKIN